MQADAEKSKESFNASPMGHTHQVQALQQQVSAAHSFKEISMSNSDSGTPPCNSELYEKERLDSLHRLGLLDSPPSEAFDRITRMAAQLFKLPIAAVSLTDTDRQWFKSRVGVAHTSIPREKAPCAQVADSTTVLVVPDLMEDPFYSDSHLARSGIRFYAGAPLLTEEGYSLGAMCVLGTEARQATPDELDALKDLASMVMSQIELQHALGRIDPISGLPNRKQFKEDYEDLIKDRKNIEACLLVMINVAKPEEVRDGVRVLGSAYFESLIRQSAKILKTILGEERKVYHVAETQFAFFSPPGTDLPAYTMLLTEQLPMQRAKLDTRFLTTTAIGIAPFLLGQTEFSSLLHMAHSAAHDAFEMDRHICVYSMEQDALHLRRFTLLSRFGLALEDTRQLSLVYQPRIDIRSGECVGAEVLLRWTDPELGAVSPGEFMPLVELSSMARGLTALVLDRAIRQVSAWQRSGKPLKFSVNISASNLLEDDFAERLVAMLEEHHADPAGLELELTESAVMANPGKAQAMLNAIASAGVSIAIDDFGTGYSSLSYLQELPAQIVKIDQSFVRDVASNERKRKLVGAMIELSHELGYRVVAEGVETAEAISFLQSNSCDEAQGYLFGRPMPLEQFTQWMAEHALKKVEEMEQAA